MTVRDLMSTAANAASPLSASLRVSAPLDGRFGPVTVLTRVRFHPFAYGGMSRFSRHMTRVRSDKPTSVGVPFNETEAEVGETTQRKVFVRPSAYCVCLTERMFWFMSQGRRGNYCFCVCSCVCFSLFPSPRQFIFFIERFFLQPHENPTHGRGDGSIGAWFEIHQTSTRGRQSVCW